MTCSKAHSRLALALGVALAGAAGAAIAPTAVRAPQDAETTIGDVGVACTGVGQTKDEARWRAYPLRLEFADARRDYIADEIVTVSDRAGRPLFKVACDAPWLLLKLPDRHAYHVEARLADPAVPPVGAKVVSPASGQARVVLTFPNG